MKYVDSHCHLHDMRIANDLKSLIERSASADVCLMATCATMEENYDSTKMLSEQYPQILSFFGIHPWFVSSRSSGWVQKLADILEQTVSGIGETGLDFTDKRWDREDQIAVFKEHLKLAKDLGRPINIHIRKAWDAFIHLLKKMGPLPVPGVVHSYSGSAQMVKVLEKYNLYLSFSGSVTRPNARKVIESLNAVSIDRLVIETDSPDILPTSDLLIDAQLNEPANLPLIAGIAAQKRQMDKQGFADQVYENSKQLFDPIWPEERSV